MKKHFKRFASFIACALILISSLPLSSLAAFAGSGRTIQVNFAFDSQLYGAYENDFPVSIKESAENDLSIFYYDVNDVDRDFNYVGTAFSVTVLDSDGWDYRITNYGPFEFYFELVIPGSYSFGWFTIPAATASGPGVLSLDLVLYLENRPANALTLWFQKSKPPTFSSASFNMNYASINLYAGGEYVQTVKAYAPQNHIGAYSSTVSDLYDNGLLSLPSDLNGYGFDFQDYGLTDIVIDPYTVNTYNLYYDIKFNTSYLLIKLDTPVAHKYQQKFYAPAEHVGPFTIDFQKAISQGLYFPDQIDGYSVDPSTVPSQLVIDPDKVNVYTIMYNIPINSSYAVIYAVTPDGRKELTRIYPSAIEGGGVTGIKSYSLQALTHHYELIPDVLDGYKLSHDLSPSTITVYPDQVTEYTLYYYDVATDKEVTIYYYDSNNKLINQDVIYVPSGSTSVDVPQLAPYIALPYSFNLTPGLKSESFNAYCFDFEQAKNDSYNEGYYKGTADANKGILDEFDRIYKEAYEIGKEDGFADNKTFQQQLAKARSEYNIFTGFFDGIFSGLVSFYDTVVDGIAIGGISLRSVLATAGVSVVLFFLVKIII